MWVYRSVTTCRAVNTAAPHFWCSAGRHPVDSRARPDLPDIILHLPSSCQNPDQHQFMGQCKYIFPFNISTLTWLSFFLSVLPRRVTQSVYVLYPTEWFSWSKKSPVTFSSLSNISLCFSFVAKQSFGLLRVCSAVFPQCNSGITIQHRAHTALCFVPFPRGCAHSSPCTACSAIVTALSPVYSWVKTYSCTLSGQLIMDFDYSHFVLLSAALSPTGGPAERPAPLIVSVSGLIEPNGNGCCQSSLSSSVYMLIHQRDIHYRPAENSSRHA